MKKSALLLLVSGASAIAADTAAAQKEEARSCTPCHSLRIVHSQRLSAAAWGKELDKMAGWGAQIADRKALLDYLSEEYSDKKPLASPEMSGDGSKRR